MTGAAKAGRLIAVVGPSGAGKDSLMAALIAARPGLDALRRVITRPSDAGGEDFDGVTAEAFDTRLQAQDFALHWQAHGLSYGIPNAQIARMTQGTDLLVNLSRKVLGAAQARFGDRFVVLNVTAPRAVLATRLAARGRETDAQIQARLSRVQPLPEGLRVIDIDNGGALSDAVTQALTALDAHEEQLT